MSAPTRFTDNIESHIVLHHSLDGLHHVLHQPESTFTSSGPHSCFTSPRGSHPCFTGRRGALTTLHHLGK